MSQVESAVRSGQCSLAVAGALLRDADVMLALKERGALSPMALSGQFVAPLGPVAAAGVARATAGRGGVLVIVEPEQADQPGLEKLAQLLASAPNKPALVVVAKQFDAFRMQGLFRGFKIEHLKERGKGFVTALPLPPADAPVVADAGEAPKAPKAAKPVDASGPRFVFVGRDEEVDSLAGLLGAGGPMVISGPSGIGKTQLLEHAIAKPGLTRTPDLVLGRGVGFDALIGRLAVIAREGGSDALVEALKQPHTPASLVTSAVAALTAASVNEGTVFVVEGLHFAAGRQGDFFRKSRLELLCEALLTTTYPLRLVFTSLVQPVFYREGRDAPLRRVRVEGLKGRFYHDIFQGMGATEVPRDKFGPLSEKLHGHALAVKLAAVAVRGTPSLIDEEKFFRMSGPDDVDAVGKQVERRVEKLVPGLRDLLTNIAHFRYPVDGALLADLGVNRKDRTQLVGDGLLDMVGTESTKRYAVHGLVRRALPPRDVARFEVFGELGHRMAKAAASASGSEKLALQQEANRMFVEARMHRDVIATEVIDQDPAVEATIGLIRSKAPRPDMAAARLAEILKADPSNADAHLLKIELLRRLDAKGDALPVAIDEALAAAPVPELFHEAVGFHLARNARNKAIKVLETAVETFPDQSRLRTRLAALLLRAGRRPEAIDHLRQAMDLDPMLPDAYGLLGMARREEGAERLDEAETLLREAVRLAPGDVVQTSRLVWLLLDIAKGVPERAEAARAEVKELLDALLQADKRSWEGHLLYAVTLRESGGDLDRAKWMLKQARKLAPPGKGGPLARFDVEEALLELSEGKAEAAEERLRRVSRKDPSNGRVFAALAKALEARGQYVAAHAELHRAAERTSPGSLDRQAMDMDLARLRALIEAGAGVMAASAAAEPEAAPEAAPEVTADDGAVDSSADGVAGDEDSAAEEPAAEESAAEEAGGEDDGFASAPASDDWDA